MQSLPILILNKRQAKYKYTKLLFRSDILREVDRNYGYSRGGGYLNGYMSNYKKLKSNVKKIDKRRIHRIADQLIIACAIALTVIVISNLDVPFTRSVVNGAKWVVGDNYNFKAETESFTNNVFPVISKKFKEVYSTVQGVFSGNNNSTNNTVNTSSKTNNTLMILPVNGTITSGFGEREDPITHKQVQHDGIDIAGKEGDSIKAALDGTVEKVENSTTLGKSVTLKHNDGLETVYGHCSEILAKQNQQVKQGDVIAKVGNTGESTGYHVHFEVIKDGKQIDPTSMISSVSESK